MSKYINADTVIQALREIIDQHKDSEMFTRTVRAAENMITIIKRMPSADVVEVVRCKDCKKQNDCGLYVDSEPEWFCADGERKETNE